MKRSSLFATVAVIIAALALAWFLFVVLLRQSTPATRGSSAAPSGSPAAASDDTATTPGRTIKIHLLSVAADGLHLDSIERDVPYAGNTVDQATAIINAELGLQAPLVSAIPKGTQLKALYVTDKGDAYVDLSPEVSQNHPGGTTAELLTVYSIVDALTMNLPAITGVQILVDGQEVDTLAGHVDLRRPLQKDVDYVQNAAAPKP